MAVSLLDERFEVFDAAISVGVLYHHAGEVLGKPALGEYLAPVTDDYFHTQGGGASLDQVNRLRMNALIDKELAALALGPGDAKVHRLGRRGGFVKKRRVSAGEAYEIANHSLEIEK
jgi:hypothetical protein